MKIGLFGGTFSPPHNGHVNTARLFLEKIGLDILYVMPDGEPPHKKADKWGDKNTRYEMATAAFGDFCTVSDYEISKTGKSYTVDTVRHFFDIHPGDTLYLLMGDDMFMSFDRWREPEEISRLVTVVYISRGEDYGVLDKKSLEYREKFGTKTVSLKVPPLPVSSSLIREKIANGEDITELVPAAVEKYITEHHLYKDE